MMVSGRLDRRITIQSKSVVKDSYGQKITTWGTFLTVWSNPVQRDGREQTADDNRTTLRPVTFRVRWNSTITNEMRVIWEGDYYKIEDIKELGRKKGLMIITMKLTQT
jgi:SPP1 family predicted phage head-tail adaptor